MIIDENSQINFLGKVLGENRGVSSGSDPDSLDSETDAKEAMTMMSNQIKLLQDQLNGLNMSTPNSGNVKEGGCLIDLIDDHKRLLNEIKENL